MDARCRAASSLASAEPGSTPSRLACASASSSASPSALMSSQSCLVSCGDPLLGLLPGVGVAPALLGLGGVLLAERGGAEDLDLFLGGQLDAFAVCVHQFLHCFDGVLQPLGVLQQQLVLPLQVREHVGSSGRRAARGSRRAAARRTGTPAPGAAARYRRRCSRGSPPRCARSAPPDRCGRSGAGCAPRHR